jgi:hypothetical protein
MLGGLAPEGKFNYEADLKSGTLGTWLGAQEFTEVIEKCSEKTIEVFWRTPLARVS